MAGRQQARTEGSLLEPLAQCTRICTIIRLRSGWQEI